MVEIKPSIDQELPARGFELESHSKKATSQARPHRKVGLPLATITKHLSKSLQIPVFKSPATPWP
jgi:hypothetical protein